MFHNALNEIVNDILQDDEMDILLDSCHDTSGGIFNQVVTSNEQPPSTQNLYTNLAAPKNEAGQFEQKVYIENLKELTGNEDEDLFLKSTFQNHKFTDMLEYMLEDTIFNLMEEATYEEFDLTQAPKIYIRKDQTERH